MASAASALAPAPQVAAALSIPAEWELHRELNAARVRYLECECLLPHLPRVLIPIVMACLNPNPLAAAVTVIARSEPRPPARQTVTLRAASVVASADGVPPPAYSGADAVVELAADPQRPTERVRAPPRSRAAPYLPPPVLPPDGSGSDVGALRTGTAHFGYATFDCKPIWNDCGQFVWNRILNGNSVNLFGYGRTQSHPHLWLCSSDSNAFGAEGATVDPNALIPRLLHVALELKRPLHMYVGATEFVWNETGDDGGCVNDLVSRAEEQNAQNPLWSSRSAGSDSGIKSACDIHGRRHVRVFGVADLQFWIRRVLAAQTTQQRQYLTPLAVSHSVLEVTFRRADDARFGRDQTGGAYGSLRCFDLLPFDRNDATSVRYGLGFAEKRVVAAKDQSLVAVSHVLRALRVNQLAYHQFLKQFFNANTPPPGAVSVSAAAGAAPPPDPISVSAAVESSSFTAAYAHCFAAAGPTGITSAAAGTGSCDSPINLVFCGISAYWYRAESLSTLAWMNAIMTGSAPNATPAVAAAAAAAAVAPRQATFASLTALVAAVRSTFPSLQPIANRTPPQLPVTAAVVAVAASASNDTAGSSHGEIDRLFD